MITTKAFSKNFVYICLIDTVLLFVAGFSLLFISTPKASKEIDEINSILQALGWTAVFIGIIYITVGVIHGYAHYSLMEYSKVRDLLGVEPTPDSEVEKPAYPQYKTASYESTVKEDNKFEESNYEQGSNFVLSNPFNLPVANVSDTEDIEELNKKTQIEQKHYLLGREIEELSSISLESSKNEVFQNKARISKNESPPDNGLKLPSTQKILRSLFDHDESVGSTSQVNIKEKSQETPNGKFIYSRALNEDGEKLVIMEFERKTKSKYEAYNCKIEIPRKKALL